MIAGPCVIESEKTALKVAEEIYRITSDLGIPTIYKSSYDKANRTAVENYRGPGLKKGLRILKKVKETFRIPVLSDVHETDEIPEASQVLDVIQIPAYLCQQTDLVVEAAKTKRPLNIKKGQFMAPWDMKKICQKVESAGNRNILLTERGTIFGYNNLVGDMRSIPLMKEIGYPVAVDATHMVRIPGPFSWEKTGGQPQFIPTLALAAVAAGCDALFLEVHPNPPRALCDAASQLSLKHLRGLLEKCLAVRRAIQ